MARYAGRIAHDGAGKHERDEKQPEDQLGHVPIQRGAACAIAVDNQIDGLQKQQGGRALGSTCDALTAIFQMWA